MTALGPGADIRRETHELHRTFAGGGRAPYTASSLPLDRCAPFRTASSTGLRRAGELIILSVNVRYGEKRPAAQGRKSSIDGRSLTGQFETVDSLNSAAQSSHSLSCLSCDQDCSEHQRILAGSMFAGGSCRDLWPRRNDGRSLTGRGCVKTRFLCRETKEQIARIAQDRRSRSQE